MILAATDERAVALVTAIRQGDAAALQRQLDEHPGLAGARVVDERGVSRTLLHVVADWPGHPPNGSQLVATLVNAGADVNAAVLHVAEGGAPETALHRAASSNDVVVLEALLDHGADIEAPGAVFTGGTPLSDAVVFAQSRAARKLLDRGATTTLRQAAALGLVDRVHRLLAQPPVPTAQDLTNALWHACRGWQQEVAAELVSGGANPNWAGPDGKTALDVAHESGDRALIEWLRAQGAQRAAEPSA